MANFRVLKYPLFNTQAPTFDDTVRLMLPGDPRSYCVKMQDGWVMMWACVDLDREEKEYVFRLVGTGQRIWPLGDDDTLEPTWVGTVMDREFVWHVFDMPGVSA